MSNQLPASLQQLLGQLPRLPQAQRTRRPNGAARVLEYAPIPVPELAIPLLPFQVEGVERALRLRRALIADEMGLGKTPQGIACAVAAVETMGQKPVLVVCPPSLRTNWAREFAKFAPNLRVETLVGTRGGVVPRADILIVGDASIGATRTKVADGSGRTRIEITLKAWSKDLVGQVGALVVDESHRFKNYQAGRTVGLQAIADSLEADSIRILLSGTPTVNAPVELVSQLQVLDRLNGANQFGDMVAFQNRYCPVTNDWGARGAANTLELHERLVELCMIRRLRADVLDLPNKGRIAVALDMDPATARRYAYAEEDLRAYLTATKGRLAAEKAMKSEAIVKLGVLRRLAGQGKVKAIAEYVQNLLDQGEQVFVATWHTDTVKSLRTILEKTTTVTQITGAESDKKKTAAVDAFQAGEARVLIGNIVAAGVGFTLTAARHIVLAELPWTPGDLYQVEDRLHRIGQTREVTSHVTIAATEAPSVDAHVWSILEAKAHVCGEVLDGQAKVLLEDDADSVERSLLDVYRG